LKGRSPSQKGDAKRRVKERRSLSYITMSPSSLEERETKRGVRGAPPLQNLHFPLPYEGRGIKGVG